MGSEPGLASAARKWRQDLLSGGASDPPRYGSAWPGRPTQLDVAGPKESVGSEPGLASRSPEVGQFLVRPESLARLDAESRIAQLTHALEPAGLKESARQEFRPEIAILIAGRLLEAGGYANYISSATLSQMAIIQYNFLPSPAPQSRVDPKSAPIPLAHTSAGLPSRWAPRIRKLWRRAPLLVLLLGWLAIGFVGGSVSAILRSYWPETWPASLVSWGFDVWGIGFLALVGLGFYAKVRDWRR